MTALADAAPAPRVLHVYTGNLYGGVETFLSMLARRRDLAGELGQHVALCFDGRLRHELVESGAMVHDLGPARVSRPWTVVSARRRLAALLRSQPFDLVVCHSSWPQALFGGVARAAGLPLVFYLHGPIVDVHWTDRWAARARPDLMIGVSRDTLESGRKIYPDVRGAVVNYPIPWPERRGAAGSDRAATRAERETPADAVVILQASRLERWKGHDLLIEALGRIADVPGWVVWFAGGVQRPHEAEYLAGLRQRVAALGLEHRTRFLGERRDVPRLLAAADIYCQANRGPEGFSLSFMEAFDAGLPIVTTALGGAPELIDATSGVLVAPGDIEGIAEGLRGLILDADLRRRLGESARLRVRLTSDPATQIGRLAELLAGVARQPSAQARATPPPPAAEAPRR